MNIEIALALREMMSPSKIAMTMKSRNGDYVWRN
jgi:hypothetical protein